LGGELEEVYGLRTVSDAESHTPGREQVGDTAEHGYLHCSSHGVGHFVKMVHNGIGYSMMAAYAEGLNILRHAL
jgi:6-phosphogluconate dehydrogenase